MKKTLPVYLFAATVSTLLVGCIIEERHYGHHHPVIVRERTVITAAPTYGAEIIVSQPPPPPRVEVVILRPTPAHVWVPGAWVWHGGWTWEPAHWVMPPRPGAVWVPHRYEPRNGGHVYVQGGWRF